MAQFVSVTVFDKRGGHDGAANGGHYGDFSSLLVKPKDGIKIEDAVLLVSDEDIGSYQHGNQINSHQTDRTTVFAVDSDKVEWACVMLGKDSHPMLGGRSSSRFWKAIDGLPAGPKVELQEFLEAYPRWVNDNVRSAIDWLISTASLLQRQDVIEAIEFAQSKSSKNRISSAWREVARLLDVQAEWRYSWTGVNSAPLKIAFAVQRKYRESLSLNKDRAFKLNSKQPVHPGEARGYVELPSEEIKLRSS